jgi:septum formation protein
MTLRLYLASASPRRQALLQSIGLDPVTVAHDCDESRQPGETVRAFVLRLAGEKARAALGRLRPGSVPGVLVAADTVVVLGEEVLGKPADASDALSMLRRLAGREHVVFTGLFVARTDVARTAAAVQATRVTFRSVPTSALAAYVDTGEPLDKAGAYGIQGRGASLVESISGSWTNVVGLPLERLIPCLGEVGVDLDALMRGRLAAD